ncbi:hypothetical protein BSZ21_02725 [Bradyrhizobium canariense]|nr:hypothetical protein BSZ21_02725 [Bradyrhizobium canariense]
MPFLILDGEDPAEFECLLAELTKEHMPWGPDEEDAVLTLAKCLWRKQRHQVFLAVRATSARYNPRHEAYDEYYALLAFMKLLQQMKDAHELERILHDAPRHLAHHLNEHCPRSKYKSAKAWIKAVRTEVLNVLLPAVMRLGPPCDELRMLYAAAVLTDDVVARELELERKLDAMFDAALDRLARLKAAKRSITLQDRRRFHRALEGSRDPAK